MLTLRTTATVTKINRKSSSPCFKNLKVGDVIEFSVPIQAVGRSGGYRNTLATYILCHNCRTDTESKLSFNQIDRVLECCGLVETETYKLYQIKEEFDKETLQREKNMNQMMKEWKE